MMHIAHYLFFDLIDFISFSLESQTYWIEWNHIKWRYHWEQGVEINEISVAIRQLFSFASDINKHQKTIFKGVNETDVPSNDEQVDVGDSTEESSSEYKERPSSDAEEDTDEL